ncbi:MAG: glycosyltransferase family 4 protein [Magnetospirillum sp.]|nr:glycosyltransferase family 4 protein [Magnetospirillum sp.]
MGRRLRVLTVSSLFPNPRQAVHGVFVENRLRHLAASGAVDIRVVAPVPWFPSAAPLFGRWAAFAGVPPFETRHGLPVWHPRHAVIPKLGMSAAPALMVLGLRRLVRRLWQEAPFDLIDAHYFYPDGVAAAWLGRALGVPVAITGRGTDLTLIPRHPAARAQIRWAAARAAACITVCRALAAPLQALGVPAEKVHVLRNGVDLDRFRPGDRAAARARLGLDGPVLLSVGLLIERKGHHLTIDALAGLPGLTLLIAGAGPERNALERRAHGNGVADRVRFLGEVPHADLAELYTAADALVLASSREGWANVLLEAMACGTPVVATDIWGTAEAVGDPAAGLLVGERSAVALAEAIRRLLAAPPDRAATRRHAERFGWEATTRGQLDLFAALVRP